MVIAQNIPALRAHFNMLRSNRQLSTAIGRISSGFRINSAKDDPTGMAITSKLSLQLAGISKATDNANNGVALIQTAEGALAEVHNMLQRMRELAVQAANDTNEVKDRDKILTEIKGLVEEIQANAGKTEYNKIKILNGEGSRVSQSMMEDALGDLVKDNSISSVLYVSEDVQPGKLKYTIDAVGTPAVHQMRDPSLPPVPFANVPDSAQISINGISIKKEDFDTMGELETYLTEVLGLVGIETQNVTGGKYLVTTIAGSDQQIEISGNQDLLDCLGLVATPTATDTNTGATISVPVKGTDAKINIVADPITNPVPNLGLFDSNGNPLSNGTSGLEYSARGNQITIKGLNGEEIKLSIAVSPSVSANGNRLLFTYPNGDEAARIQANGNLDFADDAQYMEVEFKDYGAIKIQVGGSFNNNVEVNIPKLSAETLGLVEYRDGKPYDLLNYNTVDGASRAIEQCDEAIAMVSHVRSRLGAFQNRLESTVRSLGVAEVNTESSRSRIRDTDMAKEMTLYASQNVMYQAGISIMTQANQRPMQVLSMLQ